MRDGVRWDDVTVRWMPSDATDADPFEVVEPFGRPQIDRLRALPPGRRAAFAVGRHLLGALAHDLGHDGILIESVCERCGGPHGAPRADGLALSVAYTDGLVVAAAAAIASAPAVGVDVERGHPATMLRDLAPLFAGRRAPDLAGWTRIEAALKADGRGLRVPPDRVHEHPGPDPGEFLATIPGRRHPVRTTTLDGPDGFVVSVARVPPAAAGR
ncbi:hypothetical protein GCM10022200_16830 [Microbacterium awajiense]|uniref:4'-phosphopantetheinyl transferase n=1 Tax=Microbacterium awajiense TaxID=415214 RepID=A0ABP7AKB3_9MICO